MEIWYHFSWGNDLQEIEVIKTTNKMLFIKRDRPGKENRISKHSYYADYFPTREEAIAFKRKQLERRAENDRNALARSEKTLAYFNQKYPKGK